MKPAAPEAGASPAFRRRWTGFMVVATSAPYLVNRLAAPPNYFYTWIVAPYPEDSLAYMAWCQQAAHGHWLFRLKYTALPHHAFLLHPYFLLCGWIGAATGWEPGFVLF